MPWRARGLSPVVPIYVFRWQLLHGRTALTELPPMANRRVHELHAGLPAGDVLVGERGSCSYAHGAWLAAQGVFVVFRPQRSQIVDFRPYRPAARHERDKGRPRST